MALCTLPAAFSMLPWTDRPRMHCTVSLRVSSVITIHYSHRYLNPVDVVLIEFSV